MIRNAKHLQFIRDLPCCYCGRSGETQAAHVRNGTDGGIGLKPSDKFTVPLCGYCHGKQHSTGEKTFWGKKRPLVLADKLYAVTGNRDQGIVELYRWMK